MPKWDGAKGDIVPVQVRLPRDLVRALDHRAIELELSRAQLVERLLRDALEASEAPDYVSVPPLSTKEVELQVVYQGHGEPLPYPLEPELSG